ncbi:alpha-amylase family glycosyl hydrolase [Salinactinospora qingdaonensis]|uniref:Alpha-amylase family glycosyl hydrolase n=1 Tax=Salinactinospora qingdaonensis TaxID=702744 RepID=A0ABP7FF03_9ACTN
MRWWQTGVIYEVFLRSFADASGDGVGDVQGVIQRLPYLEWLGVDVIWLSPLYPSPMRDSGYDVTDLCDVHPALGTLADMDQLLKEAHGRGLRVVLDLVINHTSAEHPWFQRSRSSREDPYRNWYIWRDPAPDGGAPNNWQSVTGGSAWSFDEHTGQYYLHSFLPFQPDLNWREPQVREAVHDVVRFWLDRGVDGFRIDMVDFLVKDADFRDEPPNLDYDPSPDKPWYSSWYQNQHIYSSNHPDCHGAIKELRALIDSYGDRVAIGELDFHTPLADQLTYFGDDDELHLPFNFGLVPLPFTAEALRSYIDEYDTKIGQHWPNYTLGNHDLPRIASRFGEHGARLAALLLLTLRGTPTLYYGDELGMTNVTVPPEQIQDPWEDRQPGSGRDPARSPMPWDGGHHAGFSTVEPWLPLGPNRQHHVAAQAQDPASPLTLYRRLLTLRRSSRALVGGEYRSIAAPDGCFAYLRETPDESMLVALNLTDRETELSLNPRPPARVLLSTRTDLPERGPISGTSLHLAAWEGVVVHVGTPARPEPWPDLAAPATPREPAT